MEWWDRLNDVPGGNALRYYLGPAYEPVNALAQFGASMLPGADLVDMQANSNALMQSQSVPEALGNAGWLGLSTLGMAVPGRPGALREPVEGIRAYHGSPHDFDRFSMDKIGTGEGGALIGRGMNFSDNPKVADYYHEQLSGGRGKRYEVNIAANPEDFLLWEAPVSGQGESVKAALSKKFNLGPVEPDVHFNEEIGQGSLQSVLGGGGRRFGKITRDGNYYTATVGKDRLGSFNSVAEAGDALKAEMSRRGLEWRGDMHHGRQFFDALGGRSGGSEALRDLGIPGTAIDGTYGAAGKSRDYAVFDDSIISILRKYGLAGLLAGGVGANALSGYQGEEY